MKSSKQSELQEVRRELMELAEIGIYRYDEDGTVLFMDRETLRILELEEQYPEPSVVHGMKLSELFEYILPPGAFRDSVKEQREVRGFEYAFRTLSGKQKWCIHDSHMIHDPDTGQRAIQVLTRDITELKQTQHQLEVANRDLADANRELRSLDELKSNLLANVSHELRSPLVTVRGYAELIAGGDSGPVSEKQSSQLQTIVTNVDRLVVLVDDLLAAARATQHDAELSLRATNLSQLVEVVLASFKPQSAARSVALEKRCETDSMVIEADAGLIFQLLTNLVGNGLKFTEPGGRVIVSSLRPDEDRVRITVEDTGCGIPDEALGRVFDRFFQVDASPTRRSSGLGLGLAISREIVERHHGEITVESRVGEGSKFTVLLPWTQPTD